MNPDLYESDPRRVKEVCRLSQTYHPFTSKYPLVEFQVAVVEAKTKKAIMEAYRQYALARGAHANLPEGVRDQLRKFELL